MLLIDCPGCQRHLGLLEQTLSHSLQCPACHIIFVPIENAGSPSRRVSAVTSGTTPSQETQIANEARGSVQEEGPLVSPCSFVILTRRPLRKTLAKYGFFVGVLLCVAGGVVESLKPRGPGPGAFVLALLLSPLIGFFFVIIGAWAGDMIELAIRLFKWRPGDSVMLALAGDDEKIVPAGPLASWREEERASLNLSQADALTQLPKPDSNFEASRRGSTP